MKIDELIEGFLEEAEQEAEQQDCERAYNGTHASE